MTNLFSEDDVITTVTRLTRSQRKDSVVMARAIDALPSDLRSQISAAMTQG